MRHPYVSPKLARSRDIAATVRGILRHAPEPVPCNAPRCERCARAVPGADLSRSVVCDPCSRADAFRAWQVATGAPGRCYSCHAPVPALSYYCPACHRSFTD